MMTAPMRSVTTEIRWITVMRAMGYVRLCVKGNKRDFDIEMTKRVPGTIAGEQSGHHMCFKICSII